MSAKGSCVFCDVDNLAGWWRYVGSDVIVFEPLNPVVDGHICFMPVEHVQDFAEKPFVTAEVMRRLSEWVEKTPAEYNVITSKGKSATQSVMHLHIHLVPRHNTDGLMLPWSK